MKVGIIAPVSLLKECCTTEIQYCIPSLLVDSKEYRDFYIGRQKLGNYLILDTCQVGWKRKPETPGVIREALKYITPSMIITPTYMYDLAASLKIAGEFLETFKPKSVAGGLEGTSTQEVLHCIACLQRAGVKGFAVPAHVRRLSPTLSTPTTIHLENHLSLKEVEGREGILVTSLPVRLGLQGRLLSDYLPSPPTLTFQEGKQFLETVRRNIRETLEFFQEDRTLK